LLAVTEGDDKPAKYPVMFRAADLVLLSKSDLLDVLDDFAPEKAERHIRALANPAGVLRISARRRESLAPWLAWLEARLAEVRNDTAHHGRGSHAHRHHHHHAAE
jgi:hydrogenase nickel incorporation protein HypB